MRSTYHFKAIRRLLRVGREIIAFLIPWKINIEIELFSISSSTRTKIRIKKKLLKWNSSENSKRVKISSASFYLFLFTKKVQKKWEKRRKLLLSEIREKWWNREKKLKWSGKFFVKDKNFHMTIVWRNLWAKSKIIH